MTDDKTKTDTRQRKQVNIYEEWEVAYWLKELGCTRQQLERAVTEVGISAQKVREYMKVRNIPY